MKAKNRILIFALFFAAMLGFGSIDVLAANITSNNTGGGVWNSAATWAGGVVPTVGDNVTITGSDIVTVNTSVQISDLTVQNTSVLKPDVGTRTITIDDDLSVVNTAAVNYNNGTGTLNFVFTGSDDGTSAINVASTATLQMNNVTFTGATVTADGGATDADSFTIYGNLAVTTGSFIAATDADAGQGVVTMTNSTAKTITNAGALTFESLNISSGSSVTSSADFTVKENLSTVATASLALSSPSTVTKSAAGTITNAGTLTFGSGTTLQISATTALAGADITNFAGTLNIAAAQLTAGTFAVSGTGNLTISGASTLSYQNTSGVAAVLNLTGTRSFPTTLSLIITGNSTTGFDYATGTDISTVDDITINASVTLSTTDSFTVGDDILGTGTLNATAGTITLTSANATTGTGTYTFFNLTLGATATYALADDITVSGSLVAPVGSTLDVVTFAITMNGTGNLNIAGTFNATGGTLATDGIFINSTGTVTNVTSFTVPTTASFNLTTGTLDMAATTITSAAATSVVLTAGTIRISHNSGFAGSFPNPTASFVSVASGINFDFYGANTQTTLGFGAAANAYAGTGVTTTRVTSIGNLTITGSSTAATSPAIATLGATYTSSTLTIAGNFTMTGAASFDITYSATDDCINFSGASKVITVASTSSCSFGTIAVAGSLTTTSNFAIKGIITGAGTLVASTPSVIALNAGAAQVSPAMTGLTLFDVAIVGANNHTPATSFTIAGNLLIHGTGTIVASAGTVTMSGTAKNIYRNTGATAPTFFGLTISGSVTAPDAATGVSAAGYTGLTTVASNVNILAAGTLTVSGTFTAGNNQTTAFAAAGTLAGTGTKSFYDLTAGGNVTSGVSLTVRNNFTQTAGAWTQNAASTTFTFTAAGSSTISDIASNAVTGITLNGAASTELALVPAGSYGTFTLGANDGVTVTAGTMKVYGNAVLKIDGTLATAITGAGNFETAANSTIHFGDGAASQLSTLINQATIVETINANTDLVIGTSVTAAGIGGSLNAFRNVKVAATALTALTADLTVTGKFEVLSTGSYVEGTATRVVNLSGSAASIENDAAATACSFGKLVTLTGATATTASSFRISDATSTAFDVQGTGTFTATAGTVSFIGATSGITVSTTGAATLYNLTINGGDCDLAASSTLTIANNLTLAAATDEFDAAPTSKVIFSGTGGVITTTANYTAGAGISLGDVEFTGSITQTGNFRLDIEGDVFTVSASGNFTPGTGGVNFASSSTITLTNNGTLVFTDLFVDQAAAVAAVLTSGSNFSIARDLNVGATDALIMTGGTVSITGTSAVTIGASVNAGSTQGVRFYGLNVSGTATETGNFIVEHYGDITVTGSLTMAAGSTSLFKNATTKSITNSGTLVFGIFDIDNIANNNVETASSFSVSGTGANSFQVGGALGGRFTATGGTVTLSGASSDIDNDNSLNGAQSITFNGLSFTGATPTFDATAEGDEIFVKGDLTFANATSFIAGNGTGNSRIWLNGTGEQTISVGVGTVDLENLTVNNSNGAKLVSTNTNITAGQLTIDKTLRLQSGDLDLNGNNIVEIDATAGLLSETPGNTVKNNGVSTSTGYIYQTIAGGAALVASNIGGLGAQVTTDAPGATTVKRYHIARTVGAAVGISRYFEISSTNANTNINFTFRYDESELNGNSEASLELVRSSTASGPWTHVDISSRDAANNFVRESPIAQFTGINSFYTLAVPSLVELSSLSLGVETSPLTAGTAAKAIGGVRLTSTGAVTVNTIRFDFSRTLAGSEFTNFKLYSSSDNDYSTSSDNSLVTTTVAGGSSSDNTVTFTLTNNNSLSNGSPRNYFIVADVSSAVTAATSAITAGTTTFTGITVTDGVVKEGGVAGTAFTFLPAIMMEENFKGLSNTPLVAGSTNNAIAGFIIQGTSSATFGGFTLATSADAQNIFENIKVYSSTDNDYSTTGDNVLLTSSVSASSTGFAITLTSAQTAITTPRYFFVVAGVKNSVDASASEITTSIAHSSFVSGAAGKRFTKVDGTTAQTTIAGRTYAFSRATATLASANMPAAGNISRNISNQTVYGFSITPDNANTVGFTGITFNVSMSGGMSTTDITSWRLHADANNNGWADAGEQISIGSLSGGQLSFASFSTAQNLTSLRRYIVTANVASNATIAGTVSLSLLNRDYVTITSPTTLNTFSAISGNTQTVRNPGTATNLVIVGNNYSSPITTGGTVSLTVQARDASGYPANVTSAETVTLSAVNATLASNTAVIASGANYVSITPTLTLASGTTSERLSVSGSALTSTAVATGIKILVAEPTTQASDIDLGTLTATTAPISGYTVGNGANRIIVVREGLPPVAPTDGTSYTAVTNLKNATAGSQTGPGSFVVLNTTGGTSAFTVLGLTPNRTYFFQAYEFNGTNGSGLENYNVAASWTSASVQNPVSGNTPDGSLGTINTTLTAAAIATDVNVSGAVTAATDTLYYQFVINSGRNNFMTKLSSMPKNYTLELYDVTAGVSNAVLIRKSEVTSTGNDIAIYNNATAGNYLIKIFGADANQFSSTNYTLRVTTSASEILSQPAQ